MEGWNLALAGCGARFPVYCGALEALESASHLPVKCIAGTSGGALIGAYLARGYTPGRLKAWIKELDITSLMDYYWPKGIGLILPGHSLAKGKSIEGVLQNTLDVKFKDLPIPLYIFAADLYYKDTVMFSKETTPEEKVSFAVRASISIPGLFPPVSYKGYQLVDGGIMNNFPIDLFDSSCNNVVGMKIISDEDSMLLPNPEGNRGIFNSNVINIMMSAIDALITSQEKEHLEDATHAKVIYLPTKYNSMDFNLSFEDIEQMYEDGKQAVRNYFNRKSKG